MDNEVILPQQSYDIEAEKPQEVKDQEIAADAIHKQFQKEIKDKKFPVIVSHIEDLIRAYGDVKELANIADTNERGVHTLAKAWFVTEMETLINYIKQAGEEDGATGGQ